MYQALYRKYRSQTFGQLVGQEVVATTLRQAVEQDKISHAYLFSGPRGTGKTSVAKIFAKAMNCPNQKGGEPCNECYICQAITEGSLEDVIEIDAASNNGVDEIRDIRDKSTYAPSLAKHKVYIIDEVHMLSAGAFNALLKTLEEPPEFAIFMLLCENYNKLLATILSRCVTFKLRPVDHNLIEKYLIDNNSLDREKAQMYARYSQGSIGRAVELSNSQDFNEIRDYTLNLARELEKADLIKMYKLAEGLKEYKDEIDTVLEILLLLYRDTLVYIKTGSRRYIIQQDKIDDIINMAQTSNTAQLEKRCDAINDTRMKLLNNGDFQLMTETLFFKIKEK